MFRNCTLLLIVTLTAAVVAHRAQGGWGTKTAAIDGRMTMLLEDSGDHHYFLGSGVGQATHLGTIQVLSVEAWFLADGNLGLTMFFEAADGGIFHLDGGFWPASDGSGLEGWCILDEYVYQGALIGSRNCAGTLVEAGDGTWVLEFDSLSTE